MIASGRILARMALGIKLYRSFVASGASHTTTSLHLGSQKKTTMNKRVISNERESEFTRDIERSLGYAMSDQPARAIQELQVSVRTTSDKKLSKIHLGPLGFDLRKNIDEIIMVLYTSHSFPTMAFPSLLDSIVTLSELNLLTIEARTATLQFAQANIEAIRSLAFETSNFRVIYYLYRLIEDGLLRDKATKDEDLTFLYQFWAELNQELMTHGLKEGLQAYEIINLLMVVLNSQQKMKSMEKETSQYFQKILAKILESANDQSIIAMLIGLASRLLKCDVELLFNMEKKFKAIGSRADGQFLMSRLNSKQIFYLYSSFEFTSQTLPEYSLLLGTKFKGFLVKNPDLFYQVLNFLLKKENRIMTQIALDDLKIFLNNPDLIPESRTRLSIIRMAANTMTRSFSFEDFKDRDNLLKLYSQHLLMAQFIGSNMQDFTEFLRIMVAIRESDSDLLLPVIDHMYELLIDHKTSRNFFPLLLSSLANLEVLDPRHKVIDLVAIGCLQIPRFEEEIVKSWKYRGLLSGIQTWYYRLWKLREEGHQVNFPDSLTILIDKGIHIFNHIVRNKIKLDSKAIHRTCYFFDTLLTFGYFDDTPEMKAKMQVTTDKLASMLASQSLASESTYFESMYVSRYATSEKAISEALNEMNIKFEREKRIVIMNMDFYLPEYDLYVEIDGVTHYTRSNRQQMIKSHLKNDYIRLKGHKLLSVSSTKKSTSHDIKKAFTEILRKKINLP